jgi:hypothetical protein
VHDVTLFFPLFHQHNRLDLIQSLVPPHYVCNGYISISFFISATILSTFCFVLDVFSELIMVELKFVQYSQGDYILCMTSRYFFHYFTNSRLLCFFSLMRQHSYGYISISFFISATILSTFCFVLDVFSELIMFT